MSNVEEKRYHWLKLKEDFFEEDAIEWLEEQENGKEYVLFYLKLCLKSIKSNGILIRRVGTMLVPYDTHKLSEMTKTDFDTVVVAMKLFREIGLVEIQDSGEIYLTELNEMIGSEAKSTSRSRLCRERKRYESEIIGTLQCNADATLVQHNCNADATLMQQNCNTDIDIEKELDIDKDIEKEKEKEKDIDNNISPPVKETRHKYGTYNNVLLSDTDMEKLKTEFPDWQERIERLSEYIASKGKSYQNHLATIRSWARKDAKQAVKSYGTRTAAEKNEGFCFNQNEDSLDDLF